jgi:hypothetical protein
MAFTQKDNSGSAFKNDRQRAGKKDADYTGTAIVSGVEYWMDIWIANNPRSPDYNKTKKTYLSHSFRPKEQHQEPRQEAKPEPKTRHAPPPPLRPPPTSEKYVPATAQDPDITF